MRCSESTLVQHVHQVDSDKLEAKDAQWTMLISGYVEKGCGEKALDSCNERVVFYCTLPCLFVA